MPNPIGRGASTTRTPQLVRLYLSSLGEDGDNVSSIHQAVKALLKELSPRYHWPRRHSFQALIGRLLWIGLLEKTGRQEDPEGRGAGILGTDRGWRQRVWVRLTPGEEDNPAWRNPMGQGLKPTAIEEPQVEAPAPPRGGPREAPAPQEAVQDLGPRVERLERERQGLVERLVAASETAGRVESFEALHQAARRFLGGVSAVYDRDQFPDAAEAMEQLANCIRLFELERELTQRRVQALRNCQRWAGLLAESLSNVLSVPTAAAPRPARGRRAQTVRPVEEAAAPTAEPARPGGVTPEQEALRQAWLQTAPGTRFSELRPLGGFGRSPAENVEYERLYQRYLESDMTRAERAQWRREQREAAAIDRAAELEAAEEPEEEEEE